MKINNETKVGLLALVSVVLLVLGFTFLKGSKVFNKQPSLYAVFQNLGALEKSNSVKINGLSVGAVYNFTPVNKEVDGIVVEIHLNRDVNIPANSIAFIDGSLVGASYIRIEKGDARTYLKAGDTISTNLTGGIIADLKTQLTPTVARVNDVADSLKLILGSVNQLFDPNTNANLQNMIAGLAVSSANLQRLLNTETGVVAQTMGNLNSVTGNLARNNEQVASTIRNVELTTANLANAPIQQTIAALQGTIDQLKTTVTKLDANLNNPNGSLGKLMNDQQLYNQLNKVALSMEILLDDVRVHPKRYVNVSVFGGKKGAEPLTSPVTKDTTATTLGN
jgi:phospholipid/cholesterol/gamma-HCH transport system substrate-binding protein